MILIKTIKNLILLFILATCVVSCSNNLYKRNNETKETLSLKESFKNDFYIGAAINEDQLLEKDKIGVAVLQKEFNTITADNNLKWIYLHPKPNVFNFNIADKFVDFGMKNNMHIVGHTLLWHSQIADFMNKVADSTVMANHIENHINTIVTRYKGKINTWDVVNEALNEDGTLRESVFLNVLGDKYIEQAFKLAQKADPEADLIYNDYNLYKPSKRAGVVKLVKQLQESGVKINGVGMQAHWGLKKPSLEDIENSIIAFSELGVKVSFTELDITVLPSPWELVGAEISQNFDEYIGDKKMNPYPTELPDSVQIQLSKRYKDIFKLFLKHEDKISRVTFWGISDKNSWLNNFPIKKRTNHPLLFDRNYQPKEAYKSVLDLKK
jgi:endo-1,4-beta-xylanase